MINQETIDKTILAIIHTEGGFVNDPADRGGATKYGVTLATLRQVPGYETATAADVKNLDVSVAKSIYTEKYAAPYLQLGNETIFKFVVNGAVQHGVAGMNKILQRSLNLIADGVLGVKSWARITEWEKDPADLLAIIVAARCEYYAKIIQGDRSQLRFAIGWMRRISADLR
jgi:lysozyme family protein